MPKSSLAGRDDVVKNEFDAAEPTNRLTENPMQPLLITSMARRKPKRSSKSSRLQSPVDSASESVVKRLDRIAENYQRLDDILCDLEDNLLTQCDELLGAMDPPKPR